MLAAGLAAAADVLGVTLGGILGHGLCTGAAVLGGKHLAEHIDEKVGGGWWVGWWVGEQSDGTALGEAGLERV